MKADTTYVRMYAHIFSNYICVSTTSLAYIQTACTSIFLNALSHSFCPGPDVEQTFSNSLIESVTALQHGKKESTAQLGSILNKMV